MATKAKDGLRERLARYRMIQIGVVGRKSGRTISVPVWFVVEDDKLYLIPVRGSETQWYRNLLERPKITVDARGATAEFTGVPVTDAKAVAAIVEKFREKYGAGDVKKYYSRFDVAVVIPMS